ncbi:MAG: NAD-dependent epimerase/dehydratase family protein [Acidimicrobiia bacterium]|nr:NAD-dependent epimerase/dehydratase family protein [Acidimicrobiia bacterium]
MNVLVTGATSLLGAETTRRLGAAGHRVRTLQRSGDIAGRDTVRGDITDQSAVARSLDGIDTVVHLAALVGATGPWHEYERVNVGGTSVVLEQAAAAGVERFVFVSSPSVAHGGAPIMGAGADPADPSRARSNYSRSKAMAEIIALDADQTSMRVVAIRPHLVWGPGDRQLIGRIVDRARAGRLATIGTGSALIDTTYIDNAADALVAATQRAEALGGSALVVSNGQPRPVAEIIDRVLRAAGEPRVKRSVPRGVARTGGRAAEWYWSRTGRSDEPPMTAFVAEQLSTAHWFDQRTTRQALGWQPMVGIDEGFERLAAWYRTGSSKAD